MIISFYLCFGSGGASFETFESLLLRAWAVFNKFSHDNKNKFVRLNCWEKNEISSEPKVCLFVLFSLFSPIKQPQQASKTQQISLFNFLPPKIVWIQDFHQRRAIRSTIWKPQTCKGRPVASIVSKHQRRPRRPGDNIETRL